MSTLTQSAQEEQVVVFQLMEQIYGIDINSVFEIIRMESITKIPRTPHFVEGVINLRGRIIPVIDLTNRFGLGVSERTQASRIIIVEVSEQKIGMIVDSVQEVLRIPVSSIEPPPPVVNGIDAAYLRGIAILEARLVILLDQNRVLMEDEKEQLIQADFLGN
ncbi:chemotaxis protein CheW [Desulforamulus aquiferis]|uniref:Chemotaxis protein CheW n=1 Tax=Desulforamulus aquiferis TaxID=1397668 RepID=A0AAW7ZG68_9FIRM|nr:chemotaxis protein CheW [Desulforamulus aquiferis]MDO7788336.1 chemotaxis protein CheW [Desulforamulus aquiferis]RYD06281.1 chemotaxis protein CheW [Desulforamulus aquiferis]